MPFTSLRRFSEKDLNPDELIIYRAGRDFFAFLFSTLKDLLFLGIGILILSLSYAYREFLGFFSDPLITIGIILAASPFLILGSYRFFLRLIDFIFDQYLITNQRVIVEDQDSLFSESIVTSNMRAIAEMELEQKGFIPTLFDFGTLEVKTMGRLGSEELLAQLLLKDIGKPKRVQKLVDEIAYRVKQEVTIVPEELLKTCGLMKKEKS